MVIELNDELINKIKLESINAFPLLIKNSEVREIFDDLVTSCDDLAIEFYSLDIRLYEMQTNINTLSIKNRVFSKSTKSDLGFYVCIFDNQGEFIDEFLDLN